MSRWILDFRFEIYSTDSSGGLNLESKIWGYAQKLSVGAAVPVFGQCQRREGPLGEVSEGLASGLIFVQLPMILEPQPSVKILKYYFLIKNRSSKKECYSKQEIQIQYL
jgi:hypothetical protein